MSILHRLILENLAEQRREALKPLTDEQLKLLWDEYDGSNRPGGHYGEDIHRELNRRGLGRLHIARSRSHDD